MLIQDDKPPSKTFASYKPYIFLPAVKKVCIIYKYIIIVYSIFILFFCIFVTKSTSHCDDVLFCYFTETISQDKKLMVNFPMTQKCFLKYVWAE